MSRPSGNAPSVAEVVAMRFARSGVRRVFGVPGGGSTSALVSALVRAGVEFKLTHTEAGAVFMASVEAELSGRPGVALATLGPGAASMVNGLAHCRLDRVPVVSRSPTACPKAPTNPAATNASTIRSSSRKW